MTELDIEAAYQSWLDGHGILTDTDWVHESFVAGWNAALEDRERLRAAGRRLKLRWGDQLFRLGALGQQDFDSFFAALEGRDD